MIQVGVYIWYMQLIATAAMECWRSDNDGSSSGPSGNRTGASNSGAGRCLSLAVACCDKSANAYNTSGLHANWHGATKS